MWPFHRRRTIEVARDTPTEIRQLIELLPRLRNRSRGSDADLNLGPRLTAKYIAAFENKHGVSLPSEYRDFLKFAGNGGAGADYGIIPLELAIPSVNDGEVSLLAMPFVNTSAITTDQYKDVDEGDQFWDAYYSDRLFAGCLRLNDSGCGRGYWIVVNGPASGTVWFDDRDNGGYPLNIRFYKWYRDWLDSAIRCTAVA